MPHEGYCNDPGWILGLFSSMIKEDGGKMEEQQKTAKMIREVVNLSQEVKVDDIHP